MVPYRKFRNIDGRHEVLGLKVGIAGQYRIHSLVKTDIYPWLFALLPLLKNNSSICAVGMKDYIFGHVEKKDIEESFALYAERVRWMEEHGIRQWNVCR